MSGRPPAGRAVPGNRWDLLDRELPAEPPRVSVVIVHFRQPAELARTLAALARQTHPADRLEVIVVDDGSPEPPAVPPGVTLLRQADEGFRAGAARDLGARHATGDVLCFLDADTTPEPEYVRRLTRLPALAPEAVTVGRRRHAELSGLPVEAPVEAAAPPRELPEPAWLVRGYADSAHLLRADDRSYRFVISAVLACSRWFYEHVGAFEAASGEYGGEDWEWAHRAWQEGALLAHVRDAVAWHDGPEWADRGAAGGAARRAAKNRETLRLAAAIPVSGSRPRALRGPRCDVLCRLAHAASPAAAFLCADTLLAALPEASVVVPDAVASGLPPDPRLLRRRDAPTPRELGARVLVDLPAPVRVEPPGLRAAVDRLAAVDIGTLRIDAPDGTPLLHLATRRALARAERWRRADLDAVATEAGTWAVPIDDEPDLEAYLGGWG